MRGGGSINRSCTTENMHVELSKPILMLDWRNGIFHSIHTISHRSNRSNTYSSSEGSNSTSHGSRNIALTEDGNGIDRFGIGNTPLHHGRTHRAHRTQRTHRTHRRTHGGNGRSCIRMIKRNRLGRWSAFFHLQPHSLDCTAFHHRLGGIFLLGFFSVFSLVLSHLVNLAMDVRVLLLAVRHTAANSQTSRAFEIEIIGFCLNFKFLLQLLQAKHTLAFCTANASTALTALGLSAQMAGAGQSSLGRLLLLISIRVGNNMCWD